MGMAHLRIAFWGCDLAWFWQRLLFGGLAMEAFLARKSRKFAISFAAEVTAVLKKKRRVRSLVVQSLDGGFCRSWAGLCLLDFCVKLSG